MYFANDENGERVYIEYAEKNGNYVCPACNSPVILKRGKVISHHFAHKAKDRKCDPWYAGKLSPWHRKMQNKFPPSMQEIVVWNKDKTAFQIADVLVDRKRYVFEFQHSNIKIDDFITRTSFYLELGYNVVWFFDYQDSKKPKCIFYEEEMPPACVKHVVWPGRDRVKFFDDEDVRDFLDDNMCNSGGKLQIYFYVSTGPGTERLLQNSDGYQWTRWEYINPFERDTYYIKPDFVSSDSLVAFWAEFYSEEAMDAGIQSLCS